VRADQGSGIAPGTGARVLSRPTTWSLALSQPLLEGRGQPGVEPRAAAAERRASDAAVERSRQMLATAVELAYWSLAEAQVVEAVFERSVEIARELVARYEALAARDLVPNLDLLTVRSGEAQRDALRINAQQARRDRSDELLLLVYGAQAGARLGADTVPVKALDTDVVLPRMDALGDLLPDAANRADVREAFARREGAALRVGRARNALLPSLALTGVYTGTADMSSITTQVGAPVSAIASNSWQLGLSLGLPVFNRRDRGGREQASATLDLSAIDAQAREAAAIVDIRTAWRAVELGTERLRRSEQAAAFAWAQLVGERQRVELGLGDPFRLLQTEEVAARAQLEATSSRFALIRGNARLRLALGRTGADN
jgi:outer membrane protein TolC